MYIFYFESVYSNGFWYWNLKVNRFDLWSILGSLALIPIHHRYIRTIYLDTEHWRRCVAALTWLPGMSHWNFFKLLLFTMFYYFFLFMEIISARCMICKCGIRNAFHWIKTIKMRKKFMRLLPSFWIMSHVVISINSKINFKNSIIFCLI